MRPSSASFVAVLALLLGAQPASATFHEIMLREVYVHPQDQRGQALAPRTPSLHPTCASWLNLVERFFAELTTKKLRRGVHRSTRQLNADIRDWIELWNEEPKPFVWTKTADQILESLAGAVRGSMTQATRTRSKG